MKTITNLNKIINKYIKKKERLSKIYENIFSIFKNCLQEKLKLK